MNEIDEIKKNIYKLLENKENLEKEINKYQNQLVQILCLKGKKECEPAYCTYRITDSCPFIDEWNKIIKNSNND